MLLSGGIFQCSVNWPLNNIGYEIGRLVIVSPRENKSLLCFLEGHLGSTVSSCQQLTSLNFSAVESLGFCKHIQTNAYERLLYISKDICFLKEQCLFCRLSCIKSILKEKIFVPQKLLNQM